MKRAHLSHVSILCTKVAELVESHIEKSLEELGLGYLDLLFMHWPAQL